jgi:ribokinase
MKIVVVGNCSLDLFFRLPRFPKAGETLLADSRMIDVGGKGSNQAVAAARSGVETLFLAALGADSNGREIRTRLEAEALDLGHLSTVDCATDLSVVYVRPDGENAIVSSHRATEFVTPAMADAVLGRLEPGDVLLMQGNLTPAVTGHCLARGRRLGALTVVNPAPIRFAFDDLWPLVDYAVPNRIEISELGGHDDPETGARALLDKGAGAVVATLGAEGAMLVSRDAVMRIPAPSVDAVDSTGAGDVFCGVFAAGLARGLAAEASIGVAVAAAALSVTRPGTQSSFPTTGELRDLYGATG